ncbi:MAG: hypothetical protein ABFR47_08505 [Verrucomicrobiota bacterium]
MAKIDDSTMGRLLDFAAQLIGTARALTKDAEELDAAEMKTPQQIEVYTKLFTIHNVWQVFQEHFPEIVLVDPSAPTFTAKGGSS